jgi:gamma-aminobutyric acid type B receptor
LGFSADALDSQIKQLKGGYANGLVGQLPFDMGQQMSFETLYQHAQGDTSYEELMVTNLVTHLRMPLFLPPPNYNYHRIELWQKILGYVLFCFCSILSLGLGITVLVLQKNKVIVASQPFFLLMICFGTLVLGSAIIPLTIDDTFDNPKEKGLQLACMSAPWLFSLGSTIIFSALFSKTWRINKIFKSAKKIQAHYS